MCCLLSDVSAFELIMDSWAVIIGHGVDFLKYVYIGPVSLYDIIMFVVICVVLCWVIGAAHKH